MADDQDRTVPLPENSEPQQPGGEVAPAAEPAPGSAPEPTPTAPPAASPTPPPPPAPGQDQPAQPYQPAAPYGQPQQPVAPGQPFNPYGQPAPGYYQQPAKSGKATGALVCGIFAILLAWAPLFGIILGIVAIVLAVKAVKEAGKDGKATGGKVCGIIGIVLSVLSFILYLVIGFGAMAYIAANPGSVTVVDNAPYSDSNSGLAATEDEKQAEAVAQAELDKLKNQDPAFVQQLAAQIDAGFADSAGYSLAELGVDPVAFVQWLLADFDYQLDGTYTSSDGTGTTYADVTMRDVYAFAGAFMTDATAFSRSTEAGSMDEAAVKAKLGELFNAAMEKTTDTTETYIGVDLVKQGDAWVVDEESWSDETELLFGNL